MPFYLNQKGTTHDYSNSINLFTFPIGKTALSSPLRHFLWSGYFKLQQKVYISLNGHLLLEIFPEAEITKNTSNSYANHL